MPVPQNADLAFKIRVAHADLDHEPIQLGGRQQLRSRGTHRVFGGQHHKGLGQIIGLTVHRHMQLLHGFQQRGLGLAGGTVDLVGQEQIGHHRAGLIDEAPAFLVVDRGDGIGGELNALGVQSQHLGKGHGRGGLAHAGNVLHQHMAARQDCHQDFLDNFVFAHNHRFDLL